MTTTKTNHALNNAIGHIESMVEDFKKDKHFFDIKNFDSQDELRENVLNSALSIQFRSDWETFEENFKKNKKNFSRFFYSQLKKLLSLNKKYY